jgi:hypothetical protein
LSFVLSGKDCRGDSGGDEKEGVAKEVSGRGAAGCAAGGMKGDGELSRVAGFAEGGEGGQIGCGLANYRVHELPQSI